MTFGIQLPLFQSECSWRPPKVSDLPSWKDAKRISIDTETNDPLLTKLGPGVRRGGYVVGYSFAIEDGPSYYVPIRHAGGDNVANPDAAVQYLKDQAKVFKGTLVGANLPYDLDYLAEMGIVFRLVEWFRDVQIADPLINELYDSYSLQNIATRWGIPGKDETLLRKAAEDWKINPKSEMWKLPARFVGAYGEQDAVLPLQLLRRQERIIDEQDLWGVYDLESRVLPVLVKMRRRGILIDWDKLDQVEQWSETQERGCLDKVHHLTNVRIPLGDVWKAKMLEPALTSIGVKVPRTPKTNEPSIDSDLLGAIKHPVAEAILRARKVNKLRTTFAQSVRNHATGGRIHCTFNQLRKTDDLGSNSGARYGRLSCTQPNLQQQPSRDDFAQMWRSIYIPDDGGLWTANDYSQQEPRMLVHFAVLSGCAGAKIAMEKYCNDPDADNHTMMARLIFGYADNEKPSKQHRTFAKIIFLGICYGMGGAKLARDLGLPTKWIVTRAGRNVEVAGDQAQAIINQFNGQVPFVSKLDKKAQARANKIGYIKTLSGRRCRFEELAEGKFDGTYKALNRLIQGSSADQTKIAMIAADAAGFKIQLQVHDEIGQTVESPEQAEAMADIMRYCVELKVPSKVDVEIGPSWGEAA
ncbi:MAG: hypothetical protein KAR40_06250 [Candidatus Sabulitectum sp.]|nr:hypothetical protein [Candidatus Sabulitectum sp.]